MDCLGKHLGDDAKSRSADGADAGYCVASKGAEIVVSPIFRDARFAQDQLIQMMGGVHHIILEPSASSSYGALVQSAEGLDGQR